MLKSQKKKIISPIKGETIYLKLLEVKDVTQDYVSWMNDPEVNKYLESKDRVFSLKDLKEFVLKTNDFETNFFFGIYDIKSKKHIGNIKIGSISPIHKRADLGLIIGNKSFLLKRLCYKIF